MIRIFQIWKSAGVFYLSSHQSENSFIQLILLAYTFRYHQRYFNIICSLIYSLIYQCYYCIIHLGMGISIKYADGLTTNNIEKRSICAFDYMFLISSLSFAGSCYFLLLICSFMIHTTAHEEWASCKNYREQFIANFCYITFWFFVLIIFRPFS